MRSRNTVRCSRAPTFTIHKRKHAMDCVRHTNLRNKQVTQMKNSNAFQDCLCDFAPLQETNLTQRLEDAKDEANTLTLWHREQYSHHKIAWVTIARRRRPTTNS